MPRTIDTGSIRYTTSLNATTADMLDGGFFVDWPNPPSSVTHLRILHGSGHVVLAVDDATNRVVGFINAISDGHLCAFIPLLEVLPDYQGRGIGTQLVERMLEQLADSYAVDLVCDADLQRFYERLEFTPAVGMVRRNFDLQAGR